MNKSKELQAQEQVILSLEKIVELTSDSKTALNMLKALFDDAISGREE